MKYSNSWPKKGRAPFLFGAAVVIEEDCQVAEVDYAENGQIMDKIKRKDTENRGIKAMLRGEIQGPCKNSDRRL